MKALNAKIEQITDQHIKEALQLIALELDRIKNLPPVSEDPKQIAIIVNKITENL